MGEWLERNERALVWTLVLANALLLWIVWLPISDTSFDDAMFVDPAARFVSGRGFTSAAHYSQGPDTFYASNVPLQQVLLIPWLRCFGFDRMATQAINLVYVVVGMLILMKTLRASELIKPAGMRIVFLGVLLASDLTVGLSTFGRPDALCFLLAVVAFAGLQDGNRQRGQMFVAISSMFAPWASLSLAAMFAFFGLALLATKGREVLPMFISAAVGGCVGVVALGCLYFATDTMDIFFASIAHYGANISHSDSIRDDLSFRAGGILRNPAYHILLVAAAVVSACALLSALKIRKPLLALTWMAMAGFPIFMTLIGTFPDYYAWMLTVPSALLICAALSETQGRAALVVGVAIFIMVFVAVGPNSHARKIVWALDNRDLKLANKDSYAAFVSRHVRGDDTALVETCFYYDAIAAGASVYAGWQPDVLKASEVAKLSLLILGDKQNRGSGTTIGLDEFREKMGPEWQPVGEPLCIQQSIHEPAETFRAYRRGRAPGSRD